MKFKVKDMDIATGGKLIAILNIHDAKRLDLHSGDRILIIYKNRRTICVLDISESAKAVPKGKIGLYEEVLDKLDVKRNAIIELKFTGKPESVKHIREKLHGKRLSHKELFHIIDDITHDRLTDIEKTYFVAAGFINGWDIDEIVDMTKVMVETGDKIKFPGITLDKHCIGGVPGNRTTMVVVPIIAAAGFTMPKTSSRAITSPAGTADTMECLAKVELKEKKIKQVVKKTKACIVHGGSMNLAPADDKIIEVEHPLSIDAEGQLLASVMAKKYSVTANHILIDIPMGKQVKAKTIKDAKHLRKTFERIGTRLNMNVKVIITDGSQPIGNGIGPVLEAEDVMSVLRDDPLAPEDLKDKALSMASILLEMTGKYKKGQGVKVANELLKSGKALKSMNEIIKAQGKQKKVKLGTFNYIVRSSKVGKVKEINNEIIAKIARVGGAPEDKGAGLFLNKKVGDKVKKGEVLYTIYAENKFKLGLSKEFVKKDRGYLIN
ncbi:AMP phosphorylase [Candidatus Woesearchaeota archaeon]|nr:AMP phosphorylase [Candidatus Woesearchaeota archaeon]MBT5397116.1 AMP phosphorylase [Candidatus Woesearchaeota archaeon]MBT6367338.1 AMP phosphorylase [Candidatus Woesearchaeota archaeon]MBT7762516.1 AMP phosphorylase [Candidatus Woesearchaeota archaeon]